MSVFSIFKQVLNTVNNTVFKCVDEPNRFTKQLTKHPRVKVAQKPSDRDMKIEIDPSDAYLSPQDKYIERYKALNEGLNVNKKAKFKRPGGLPLTDEEGNIIRIKNGSRFFTNKIYTARMQIQDKPSAVLYESQTEEELETEEIRCYCTLL